jgi:hypothetical protein
MDAAEAFAAVLLFVVVETLALGCTAPKAAFFVSASSVSSGAPGWHGATTPQSPASGIPPSFFAMTLHDASDWPPFSIGAVGHPTTLVWGWLEPSRGSFNWAVTDSYVEAGLEHHIPVTLTIAKTPPWAASDKSACKNRFNRILCDSPPSNLEDWKDFITALVTHYKGKVNYYELWNEANQRNYWTGAPEDLVTLAKVAYPIVKSIDPSAMVLTPSTTGPFEPALEWTRRYLEAGGGKYADGGTFHGYVGRQGVEPFPGPEQDSTSGCAGLEGPERPGRLGNWKGNVNRGGGYKCFGSLQKRIEAYRSVYDHNGLKGKPIFDTEGSWGDETISDPDVQASFLARWYLIQAGLYDSANLQYASWFAWGHTGHNTWGVIENPDHTPTQAGLAYTEVYKWLVGANVSQCKNDGPIWTCAVTRSGGYQGLAIWDNSQTCGGGSCSARNYKSPPGYVRYCDLSGSKTAIDEKNVRIGLKPILLESQ